jgi:hypothetical protein
MPLYQAIFQYGINIWDDGDDATENAQPTTTVTTK